MASIRPPAVAGRFYPDQPNALRTMVQGLLDGVDAAPRAAVAAVVPHAGLVYSGQCAAQVFKRLSLPSTIVILAPNHTGRRDAAAGAGVWESGFFETPLGDVPIAEAFLADVLSSSSLAEIDRAAHHSEHAIEVELPFVSLLRPGAAIAPIVLAWDSWLECRDLASTLAAAIERWSDPVLVLASSDMTHYEDAASAEAKDREALDRMSALDGEGLLAVCRRRNITMCGRAPAAVAVETARLLGATEVDVVDYRHSGWVTGDDRDVVAYAGVVIR